MKLTKKQALVLGSALLVFAVVFIRPWGRAPSIKPAKIEHRPELKLSARSEGKISAGQEAYLVVRKGGKLSSILRREGEAVTAGEILATVDETENKAQLKRALSSYRLAASESSRSQALFSEGAEARESLDQTSSRLSIARAELEQAKQRLEDALVRAPHAGTLASFIFKLGDFVPDGATVGVIENRGNFQLVVKLEAGYLSRLPKEAEVELERIADKKKGVAQATLRPVNPESDYDGLARDVRLQFNELPTEFEVNDRVRVAIPVVTFTNVTAIRREDVLWDSGMPEIITVDSSNLLRPLKVDVVASEGSLIFIQGLPERTLVAALGEDLTALEAMKDKTPVTLIRPH